MSQLSLDGAAFSTGSVDFLDDLSDAPEQSSGLFVPIECDGFPTTARLDTAAPFLILNKELIEELSASLDPLGIEQPLSTRMGDFSGTLNKLPVRLVADEGESLEFDVTVFACDEWPGPTFVGYSGFLEFIRFAIDPGTNRFFFGPLAE